MEGKSVRRFTNLEVFREYVEGYVMGHPKTHQRMTLMVRQLAQGPHGVPIEVYCLLLLQRNGVGRIRSLPIGSLQPPLRGPARLRP